MPDIITQQYQHRAEIDAKQSIASNDPILFKWHWPRGTLAQRMSALELATFLLPHMPCVLPLLSDHPNIYLDFQNLLLRLTTWPKQIIDEVVPWIKSVTRTSDHDVIELAIGGKFVQAGPTYFVLRP